MKFIFLALLFCALFGRANSSQAASHYVREGASGANNGSDWTNAWTTLPAALTRGDTYYIADGTYGSYTFDDAESGTSVITVKKAIASDHGTDAGWQTGYGDGQTFFTNTWNINSGYFILDGQTGGGPGSWESGHGFKINTSDCAADSKVISINNGADFVEIYHTDMQHCGMDNGAYKQDVIYSIGGSSDIVLAYNYMHDVNRTMMLVNDVQNIVVEYNMFKNRHTAGDDPHGEAVSINYCGLNANNTFRHNYFKNISGTGFIVPHDSVQSLFYIYGNVFDTGYLGNGAVCNSTNDTSSYMYVYNNVFANITGFAAGIYWDNGSNNHAYNNIWINNDVNSISFTGTSHDYNLFYDNYRIDRTPGIFLDPIVSATEEHGQQGSSDPFVDSANGDFMLIRATDQGMALSSPFDVDLFGVVRGADSVWDRGAFEFVSGGDAAAPAAPSGLSVQ